LIFLLNASVFIRVHPWFPFPGAMGDRNRSDQSFEDWTVRPYHVPMRCAALSGRARLACRGLFAAMLFALVLCVPAHGQQEFKLGEDDTWRELEAADPTTPEGQIAEARKALAGREYTRAYRLADQWIERNDRHPLLAQAYLIRADATVGLGDEYEALFDY
jgi:hypothetical protein